MTGAEPPGGGAGDPLGTNDRRVQIGRRILPSMAGLGAVGIVVESDVQRFIASDLGSGLGGLLPGIDRSRNHLIAGSFPAIVSERYRLELSGPASATMEART